MKNCFVYILASIILISCVSSRNTSSKTKNMVVAHRGAFKKNNLPENSIASLREAIRLGCAGSEFDVRMTKDGILVINHDPHYHDMEVEKSNYSDLAKIKLSNGETLPTLKEYIEAGLKNNPATLLVCEIKTSSIGKEYDEQTAIKTVQLIKELHAEKKTIYISFGYHILEKILEQNPAAHTQYLNGDKSPLEVKKDGIDGIDYHFSVFKKNPQWIVEAKANKITLNAWTVNEAVDMKWLVKEGFDYITTNEPEQLLTLLKVKY